MSFFRGSAASLRKVFEKANKVVADLEQVVKDAQDEIVLSRSIIDQERKNIEISQQTLDTASALRLAIDSAVAKGSGDV